MDYRFVSEKLKYDGTQLASRFAYLNFEILGDSVVAFAGPCDIPFEHMVDGEDLLAKAEIRGGFMLHFIIEEFGQGLEFAVTRQRLFAALVMEEITKLVPGKTLRRDGDDLYYNDGKLSISIATVSPVSSLIHFAVNITNENTPVKTASLGDLGIVYRELADAVGRRFTAEVRTIKEATCKVRWVQ